MLFNFQSNKLCRHFLAGGVLCAAALGFNACTPDYNLDEDQPTGLNTIYGYMADAGNYKNFLRLIDDLGETETLSKTGSKTLFIADDDAFAEFYANNEWGVKSYDQLSDAQKKIILRSSMIDNPYSISLMSNVMGPIEGECMRRTSSLQVYDTVALVPMNSPEIPNTSYWTNLAQTHDSIYIVKDASGASPMIHFLPRFLTTNMITDADVDFLYNEDEGTHVSDDAYVNSCKVIEANIFCKNGFLHKVNKVMLPLDNMAEIIRKQPNTKDFSYLLDRFSAPFSSGLTTRFNEIYGLDVDTVYQKAYFATRGNTSSGITSTERNMDKDENSVEALLKYDPGWNRYSPGSINDPNRDEVMEDMGCMLVPTDEALRNWWDNEGGKVLKDNYGTWANVPNKVVRELIKNNQLMSFVSSVPSKFNTILNDAAMEMGITTADVDSVILGCNGAVYLTNKVFAPTSYSSVLFPALVTDAMSVIYNAISVLQFDAYLNSMVSRYSFFIPLNDGMLTYIDPVSLGQNETHMWKFRYDPNGANAYARIKASVFTATRGEDGTWIQGDSLKVLTGKSNTDEVYDRLVDILDNIIVIGDIEQGKYFYKTKGNNYVKVGGQLGVVGSMTASGGWQVDNEQPETVTQIYNMDNGKSYVTNSPLYTSHNACSDVFSANSDFSEFYSILQACGALSTATNSKVNWSSVSKNGNLIYIPEKSSEGVNYLLNTYHYTIYAPTNEAMEEAYAMGLPTLEMLDEAMAIDEDDSTEIYKEIEDSAAHLRKVMLDFVKYHIQDNSIYIDNGFESGNYETAKTNASTGRSFKVAVDVDANDLYVEGVCSERQKINKDKMYNVSAREYWLNNYKVQSATLIETSSSVVLHAVDHPLLYKYKPEADLTKPENNQFVYSPNDVYSEEEEEAVKTRK